MLLRLSNGAVRFGALLRGVEGISQKMLTQTLRSLERDGLVLRRVLFTRPLHVEYTTTALGRHLVDVSTLLKAWAEQHLHAIEKHNASYDRQWSTTL